MRVPPRPQKTKRQRMDSALQGDPKEKLGKRGFLRTLGKSLLTSFSSKSATKPQPPTEDDFYSEEDGSDIDAIADTEPPFRDDLAFEEERVAFSAKGKSALNAPQPRPLRNLIGESSPWRQDEWPNTAGRTLPRTPVGQPRLYPDLSAVVESVEAKTDEQLVETCPGNTVKRNRTGRVKGEQPVRASARLKERAAQALPPTEVAPIDDNYINLVDGSESVDEDDDFGSTKSHVDPDEEDRANIEARVEADLTGNETVPSTTTRKQSSSLQFSSTPLSHPQNLYTAPAQQTIRNPAPRPPTRVESHAFPPRAEPLAPPTLHVDNQPSTSKPTQTPIVPSQYLNSSNPFRQAVPLSKPLPFFLPGTNPFCQPVRTEPPNPPKLTMASPSPYEILYRYLRGKGASREEAATEAKGALGSTKSTPSTGVVPPPDVVKKPVDCSSVSNQSYYNNQKLLQNQQQQTIALLAQVPAFSGLGSTKFEDWIQHFERVVDTAEFEEGRKIKLLGSKLFGSAGDCITTFQLNYPKEAQSFIKVKQNLHERFHGGDNRKMYFTEFKNCVRNSGESIRDYACRLQKLYSFAYPTEVGKQVDPAVLQLRETMLMDGFLGGLKPNLRERMSFKDYKNLNDLVKATEKCAAVLNEAKLEKRSVEFVNAISATANAREMRETKNEITELKSVIEQLTQQLSATMIVDSGHEAINAVATNQTAQLTESKKEIEELKNLLKASNKSYSDMMKQSREAEKAMKNLQLQVAGMSQPIPPAQPIKPLQPHHSNQFIDHSAQVAHHPSTYRNPPPPNRYDPSNQTNGPAPRGERYCAHCAVSGRNPTTHNTDKCGWGPNGPTCFKCHQSGHIARDCPSTPHRLDPRYAPPVPNVGQLNPWNQEN